MSVCAVGRVRAKWGENMTITKNSAAKCVVGTVIGTAVFVALTKVQIPIPFVQNTSLQVRVCILTLVAMYFDPITAFIVGFAGHALGDAMFYGGAWWSWVIPDGIMGGIMGLAALRCQFGRLTSPASASMLLYFVQFVVNMVAWAVVAPILDVLIYGEEMFSVLYQGLNAALGNIITCGALCTPIVAGCAFYRKSSGAIPVPVWDIA